MFRWHGELATGAGREPDPPLPRRPDRGRVRRRSGGIGQRPDRRLRPLLRVAQLEGNRRQRLHPEPYAGRRHALRHRDHGPSGVPGHAAQPAALRRAQADRARPEPRPHHHRGPDPRLRRPRGRPERPGVRGSRDAEGVVRPRPDGADLQRVRPQGPDSQLPAVRRGLAGLRHVPGVGQPGLRPAPPASLSRGFARANRRRAVPAPGDRVVRGVRATVRVLRRYRRGLQVGFRGLPRAHQHPAPVVLRYRAPGVGRPATRRLHAPLHRHVPRPRDQVQREHRRGLAVRRGGGAAVQRRATSAAGTARSRSSTSST